MKNTSFESKIKMIAFSLYATIMILLLSSGYGMVKNKSYLLNLGNVQVPAIKNVGLADMMHDGLRAVVFRAIIASKNSDPKEKQETVAELVEFTDNFRKYISHLDQLELSPKSKAAVEGVKPDLKQYIESAEDIVKVALSGNESKAVVALEAFQTAFEKLEKSMGELGDIIEKEADSAMKEGIDGAALFVYISIGFGLVSLLLGAVIYQYYLSTIFKELKTTGMETVTISSATQQVNQNIQGVASAMEEMSHSIREIGSSSSEAARVAREAVDIGSQSNDKAFQLRASSEEIGKVTRLISQVAERTSMLALNATIEAARAGEAGRGFAVVADEVKDLAKQTSEATDEITKKIQAIQSDSQEIVTSLKQVTDVVNQINDLQSTIASAVEEQTVTVAEISKNLSQAAGGTQDISIRLRTVAQVVQSSGTESHAA